MSSRKQALTGCVDPGSLLERIQQFLEQAREPVLWEPGELPYLLKAGSYQLERKARWVLFGAWDEKRSWSRRVVSARVVKPGQLELLVERFGGALQRVYLRDRARPQSRLWEVRGDRHAFAATFRKFLYRQFPGWELVNFGADADLSRSLSPAYPRAVVKSASGCWAAIAAPPEGPKAPGVLAYGLIWLAEVMERYGAAARGLAIFLPEGWHHTVSLRLKWLSRPGIQFRLFVYDREGLECEIDPRDAANLQSSLERWTSPLDLGGHLAETAGLLRQLCRDVQEVALPAGVLSFRIRGLEIARWENRQWFWGLDRKRPLTASAWPRVQRLVELIQRYRCASPPDPLHPLYLREPERWLEALVRANPTSIDPELCPGPVYGQVPAVTGLDRDVLDLLAVERSGRLVVIEIKAGEDPQLPLQALDYWMRVEHHLRNGSFQRFGYFPRLELSDQPPRLVLLAPCLQFHPSTEQILSFYSPKIPVERVGLAMDWRQELKVVFRVQGAQRPGLAAMASGDRTG